MHWKFFRHIFHNKQRDFINLSGLDLNTSSVNKIWILVDIGNSVTKIQVCLIAVVNLVSLLPTRGELVAEISSAPVKVRRPCYSLTFHCLAVDVFPPSSASVTSVYLMFSFCLVWHVPLCGRSMNEEKKGGDKSVKDYQVVQRKLDETPKNIPSKTLQTSDTYRVLFCALFRQLNVHILSGQIEQVRRVIKQRRGFIQNR